MRWALGHDSRLVRPPVKQHLNKPFLGKFSQIQLKGAGNLTAILEGIVPNEGENSWDSLHFWMEWVSGRDITFFLEWKAVILRLWFHRNKPMLIIDEAEDPRREQISLYAFMINTVTLIKPERRSEAAEVMSQHFCCRWLSAFTPKADNLRFPRVHCDTLTLYLHTWMWVWVGLVQFNLPLPGFTGKLTGKQLFLYPVIKTWFAVSPSTCLRSTDVLFSLVSDVEDPGWSLTKGARTGLVVGVGLID